MPAMRPAVPVALRPISLEGEPVRGLPGPLPAGEAVLWQGAPDWRALAVRAFHVRAALALAMAMAAASAMSAIAAHLPPGRIAAAIAGPLLAGGALAGLMAFSAWINARVSIYTVTSRRVVLRVGLAIPLVINLPFREIADVSLAEHADGGGDIALAAAPGARRLSALMLWPHARPGRLTRPEPTLRCVPDAPRAAAVLVAAMRAAAADQPDLQEVDRPATPDRPRAPARPRLAPVAVSARESV